MVRILALVAEAAGLTAAVIGLALWSVPLALVVGGATLVYAGERWS